MTLKKADKTLSDESPQNFDADAGQALIGHLVSMSKVERDTVLSVTRALTSTLLLKDGFDVPTVIGSATTIYRAYMWGESASHAGNKPDTLVGCQDDLAKLAKSYQALVDQISALRRPSLIALWDANCGPELLSAELTRSLIGIETAMGLAGSVALEQHFVKRRDGRVKGTAASATTDATARIYERLTGQKVGFTRDPASSTITGHWPETLQAVFLALGIESSVAAQVQAYATRKNERKSR